MEDANKRKKIHNLFDNLHHLNQKEDEKKDAAEKQLENSQPKKEIRLSRAEIIKGLRMGKSLALQTELRNRLKQAKTNRRRISRPNKSNSDFSKNREEELKKYTRNLPEKRRKFVEKMFKENGVTPYTMALLKKVRSDDDYQNIPDRPHRVYSRQPTRSR